jgi:hypothetical protein
VSTSDDKKMLVWEWGFNAPIKYISDPNMHAIPAVTMHPSGRFLAAQSMDNQIKVFDAGEKVRQVKRRSFKGHHVAGFACQIAFSPNGRYVYVYVCMYVCVCVSWYITYVCVYVYMYVCIYAYSCMYVYVFIYVCVYVCMYVCLQLYICVCIYICIYVCISVCLYICMSVCMFMCMYVIASGVYDFPHCRRRCQLLAGRLLIEYVSHTETNADCRMNEMKWN